MVCASTDGDLLASFPYSGRETLKLCGRGEPGQSMWCFSHMKSTKGRHEVDATLIVHGLRTGKRAKYIFAFRGSLVTRLVTFRL